MKQNVANYTILIEKQKRTGSDQLCYTAFVPILGIATEAETINDVQKQIKSLIQFHIESLVEEGEEVPIESGQSIISKSQVNIPENAQIAP